MKRTTLLLSVAALYFVSEQYTFGQTREEKSKALMDTLMAQKHRQDAAAVLRRQHTTAKNNQAVFGEDDPIFKNTQVPEKWKSQSAVILACKTTYTFYIKASSACFDEVERKRIKVLDKSAIDNLSTFYFIPTNDVGFTLIKKDGTTIKINLDEAVPVDEYIPVPTSYLLEGAANYLYSKSYKKIAISNLEPGDIIDYYYKYSSTAFKEGVVAVPFPSVAFTLTGEYPVVAQKIKLKAEKDFYINFASYNGAASLAAVVDTSRNSTTYILLDTNRNKRKDEIWENAFRSEPTVKFQVVYSTDKDKEEVPFFLGNSSAPKTSVSADQLKTVANQIALESSSTIEDYSSAIIKYMRKNHGDIKDPVLYMKYAYNYFRYFLMIGDVGDENESNFSDDMDDNLQNKTVIRSEVFVNTLGLVCRDRKIDYDLLLGVPRNKGTLDNLIYPAELRWVIRINGSPSLYLYPFDSYKDPGEADLAMEGIDMYTIIPNKKIEKVVMSKTTTPVTTTTDNNSVFKSSITLNADMLGGASIERTAQIAGLVKEPYYPDVIAEGVLLNKELKRYNEKSLEDYLKKIHNDKKKKEEERKITLALSDEQKDRLETMKDYFKNDFDISSYDDFQLMGDGRQIDSNKIIFTDKFKVKDVVHKVGPNYIVDAGKFLGKQLELKEDQLTRTDDIFVGYAAEFDDEIRITIPAGYKPQGLDALNINVTNSTGGFISTATLNGNTVIITVKKHNTHNFEPKGNWADMVKFLQAAVDFTQKKILLKKG